MPHPPVAWCLCPNRDPSRTTRKDNPELRRLTTNTPVLQSLLVLCKLLPANIQPKFILVAFLQSSNSESKITTKEFGVKFIFKIEDDTFDEIKNLSSIEKRHVAPLLRRDLGH